jgi:phage terminase Nu1 subunit (DNA packaging protein)
MGYINGLRSFGYRSQLAAARSISKKRESTDKWMDALARAEHAHWLCRKAAELAGEERFKEAEETAISGINELKERSVSTQFSSLGT